MARDHARGLALEVLVGRVTVDGHHARAGHDPNASNGGLSLTSGVGAVVSGTHDQAFAFAFFFWVGLGIGTGFCAACGMVGCRVDLELGQHLAAEDVLRQHAFDGLLNGELGLADDQVAVGLLLEAAGDAGVVRVELLVELVAGRFTLAAFTTMTKSPQSTWGV